LPGNAFVAEKGDINEMIKRMLFFAGSKRRGKCKREGHAIAGALLPHFTKENGFKRAPKPQRRNGPWLAY